MSTLDRALDACRLLGYGPREMQALIRMARDADHETGENCITSLARIHEAAGYADDDGRFKSAGRALQRFVRDDVIRCDLEADGVGRLWTVVPVGPWSGEIGPSVLATDLGRKLASWKRNHESTPDVKTSGVPRASGNATPDVVRTATPDTTPDVFTSGDLRTNVNDQGPTSTAEGPDVEEDSPSPPAEPSRVPAPACALPRARGPGEEVDVQQHVNDRIEDNVVRFDPSGFRLRRMP